MYKVSTVYVKVNNIIKMDTAIMQAQVHMLDK